MSQMSIYHHIVPILHIGCPIFSRSSPHHNAREHTFVDQALGRAKKSTLLISIANLHSPEFTLNTIPTLHTRLNMSIPSVLARVKRARQHFTIVKRCSGTIRLGTRLFSKNSFQPAEHNPCFLIVWKKPTAFLLEEF